MTVMGIAAKREGWEVGEITAEIDKTMAQKGPREIKSISIKLFMPIDLSIEKLRVLQKATEDCPVIRSLKSSLKITVHWITNKRRY